MNTHKESRKDKKEMEELATSLHNKVGGLVQKELREYVSNCCSVTMNPDSSICPDCKEHAVAVENNLTHESFDEHLSSWD